MRSSRDDSGIPPDYPVRIKRLRASSGLTQASLAELLGVSFATVNRWENAQSRPSALAWRQIARAEEHGIEGLARASGETLTIREASAPYTAQPEVDFSAIPDAVWAVAEGERLSYGHLFNPAFASEISLVEPLPHQRIAVYEHLLPQPRLRFLLADDAGAGKTIMAGLCFWGFVT